MALSALLKELKNDGSFMANVSDWTVIPSKKGEYVPIPQNMDVSLQEALKGRGIERLYSHQGQCWETAQRGEDFVVVTPTASGKTLCYNLPVLNTLLQNPASRALYLFPTKALSQDQQASLNDLLLEENLGVPVYTFDGDTPSSIRMAARQGGRIIITNPDMLHSGVLPNHTKWIEFFRNLEYIVLDELHTYTGVFGSHMANLMRRLLRVCRFYGSSPRIIAASATIGNPAELAQTLVGRPVQLINGNGAPSGEKHLVLYNPPLVDAIQGIRRSVVLEARRLALRLLKSKVKTIVFTQSRIHAELVSGYINESLTNVYNENHRIRVEAYRGGYLPQERRAVEKGLRDGSIHGVVSTNALELGIDIGGLDAAVLAGIPSSVASAWQRAGRAGRSGDVSLALLVGSANPTDQYLVRHPDYFLSRSPESAYLDPQNLYILADHLKCAAFELPFEEGEDFGGDPQDLLAYLEEQGVLRQSGGRWYWADRSYPSERVSLRRGGDDNVVIVDETGGRNIVIGEMDAHSAREMLHDEAIYLHRGEQFQVKRLDLANHHAYVESSTVNYYTDALVKSDIKVLEVDWSHHVGGVQEHLGDLLVRSQVAKYKKIRFGTHENVGFGDIHLPEEEMHTRGAFLAFIPQQASGLAWAEVAEEMKAPVLSRVASLLRRVAPVFLRCQRGDLGVLGRIEDPHHQCSGIYVYDNIPGGIGLAEGLGGRLQELVQAAHELLSSCGCEKGCPSCTGAADERDVLAGNPKVATAAFLGQWLRPDSLRQEEMDGIHPAEAGSI
ncbi:MAG: DEAD/DEAH box helicase [Spirochaetales bacterium]|nr:DEAD/DEAH box helicase [Spirochaetales bacterium]